MAAGALTARVTVRPQMARFAVVIGPVVKVDLAPIAGVVAVRALAGPVSHRRYVARPAVGQVSSVAEADPPPALGVVASGTLVEVMNLCGCSVARLAVGRDVTVVKVYTIPAVGAVAVGTLPIVMLGGRLRSVTARAVREIAVVKGRIVPRTGFVAA